MTLADRIAVLVGLALTGCRPALEEGLIICRDGGDASCPTGWHCDADAVCRRGDAPPAVRWLEPSADAAVIGRTSLHFEARSLRGLGKASVRVVSPRGLVTTLSSEAVVAEEGGAHATYAATWASWTVADGSYELEAVVDPGTPPEEPGRSSVHVRVSNGVPVITISSPPDGALVDGEFMLNATFAGHVPVTGIDAGLQQGTMLPAPSDVPVSFSDDDHLSGLFAATLDASGLENGPAIVAIHVHDALGHTTTTGIPVIVEHPR
ncbi:MAG: hypothetical protein RL199_2301 [Pseudomonadota bacterium]